MKRYLLSVSLLFFLCACSSPDTSPLNTSSVDTVRFNALISCLGDKPLPTSLTNENAFTVVDYFGEPASLGNSELGSSNLQDPWCLLTVDVTGYPADEAFDTLSNVLNTEPTVWLRTLALESQSYTQDRGAHSFDPHCDDLAAMEAEASSALPISADSLRSQLGVHSSDVTGEGVSIAVLDGGVGQPRTFRNASEVARFSRSFLAPDYPSASNERSDIKDRFDCNQTAHRDGHGSLVTEIISSVAPGADQMMLKVCDDNGACPSSSVAKALLLLSNDYENFPKIDIVNMSFGGNLAQDEMVRQLIERMIGMNFETLIVTSVGNNADAPAHYPADYFDLHHGIIPVAAAKKVAPAQDAWQLAEFNTRPVMARKGPDLIAAPGVGLELNRGNPEGVTGTSFAAPVVSAMAALERQHRPLFNTTALSLHTNLLNHAEPFGTFKLVQFSD